MKIISKKTEMRKAYFLKAFNRLEEEMAIISFGKCNFCCPYCKRGGQYIDSNGNILQTQDITIKELLSIIDDQIKKGRRIRLSGGDPVAFPNESLEIAQYIWANYEQKISIAHNGSSLELIKALSSYLEYIALDFKAYTLNTMKKLTGISSPAMQQKEILLHCQKKGILVDVRTPIFQDSSWTELYNIAHELSKYHNVFWTLRKYNPVAGCAFLEPTIEDVLLVGQKLKKNFPNIKIGVRNYWKGGFEIL